MGKNTADDRPAQTVKANGAVVACLGSSSTASKGQAFDFIGELRRRPGNSRFHFRNFGVGRDLAYNALQRLPDVLACRPEKVVVWVGANDVLALVSPKVRWFFRMSKHLPVEPSPEWFREDIHGIARRLKKGNDGQHSLLAGGAFTSFRFLPFYRDAFRVVVLGRTPDEVAQLNGWRFHSDGVHLNIRREIIAADLIQQFID